MSEESGRAAVIAALAANIGIAAAKFVAFAITGSAGMLAEGLHSVADSGNQGLLLLGRHQARRPADPAHPFGFERAHYLWAFVVAIMLFSVGGLFSVVEGVEKLLSPHEVTNPAWAFGVLAIALAMDSFSLRTAGREAQAIRGARSWWSFIRTTRNPDLAILLLEDSGAIVGLIIAGTGLGLATVTGNTRWDAMGSLAIGILLVSIALLLGSKMKSLVIGEAAAPADLNAIRAYLEEIPGIDAILDMRTEHLGPESMVVVARVRFDANISFEDAAGVVADAKSGLQRQVPAVDVIYLEPGLS